MNVCSTFCYQFYQCKLLSVTSKCTTVLLRYCRNGQGKLLCYLLSQSVPYRWPFIGAYCIRPPSSAGKNLVRHTAFIVMRNTNTENRRHRGISQSFLLHNHDNRADVRGMFFPAECGYVDKPVDRCGNAQAESGYYCYIVTLFYKSERPIHHV